MGRSREITGLVASIITLLAMGVAVAQDATWKDCELAARDPDRSIAACSKILKRPSSQAQAAAFHHRGLAYAAKGKLDQAISDISAGIRLDPQSAYRWQERGELYARQGNYQQAIADITEAIRKDSTPRAFRFHSRAQAYESLGDLTRAIADFDEAIRLDPEARSFRFRARANALRDAGRYDRALADYETALKLTPTNVWALVDRGRTYARMGRSELAKSDFDNALTLDSSNAELRRVIEVEVAALANAPSTAQEPPPQSPSRQQSTPAQRPEGASLPGQSPPSTAQETPPQSSAAPTTAPAQQKAAVPAQPQKAPSETPKSTLLPCDTLVVSRPYFVAECIALGMEKNHRVDGLSNARATAQRERDDLKECSADSLVKVQQMAMVSSASILRSGAISQLMDFGDAMKLECSKAADRMFKNTASQGN